MDAITIPHSVIALVFYALWAIALALMVGADRVLMVMRGQAAITSFTPGAPHGSDSYWRINRAHINTVENLAIFAAIVLAGWVAGMESALFNRLAVIVVVARVIQSAIHIASGSAMAINLRFAAFGVQLVCEIWMAVLILQAANLF
ncbi:MAG TPA: MAPEG family protein [Rhizomicrobium sp.]|nr:MAPEG family protein [Rhizomicrobium sp.]